MQKFHVVICDDEKVICNGVRRLIEQNVPEVEVLNTYADGELFVASDDIYKADLVISDIKMKHVGGLELVSHLKRVNKHCMVIFISGYQTFAYAHFAINNQVAAYLTKPIDTDELLAAVNSCIQKLKEQTRKEINESAPLVAKFSTFRSALQYIYSGYDANLANLPLEPDYRAMLSWPFLVAEIIFNSTGKTTFQLFKDIGDIYTEDFICCCVAAEGKKAVYFLPLASDSAIYREKAMQHIQSVLSALHLLYSVECTVQYSFTENIVQSYCSAVSQKFRAYQNLVEKKDTAAVHTLLKDIQRRFSVKELQDFMRMLYKTYVAAAAMPEAEALRTALENIKDATDAKVLLLRLDALAQGKTTQRGATIAPILDFIEANYGKPLSLKMISENFAISNEHLCRLFKNKVGINFKQYVLQIRMEHAKKILLDGRYNISETARLVGFENPSTFTAMFKKYVGLTPHDFVFQYTASTSSLSDADD